MKKILLLCILLLFFNSALLHAKEAEFEYYALYLNGSRCGYEIQSRQEKDGKVISKDEIFFELERMGTSIKLNFSETAIETMEGRPLEFKANQKASTMEMAVDGKITPDGKMKVKITNAGNTMEQTKDYPRGAVMTEGLRRVIIQKGLKYGAAYSVDVFSPSNLIVMKMTFNVGEKKQIDLLGRIVELVEVKGEYSVPGSGKSSLTYYVDDDYTFQKIIMPMAGMDVESIACSESFARSKLEVAELVDAMVVKSPKPINDLAKVKEITYILKPSKTDMPLSFPQTDSQKIQIMPDKSIRLTVRAVQASRDEQFPYKGKDPEILKALESTQYLQANHPDIIALSKKATGGKKTALDAAREIESFVSSYIDDKNLSVGYASALEVAKSRQGDCTEHAVLTAALCRAAGIPARVIMGIVYARDYIFMGHAWTEAYIGDKWVSLDAALKDVRNGFDPGHITLSIGNGDSGDFFGIMNNLGNFTIEDLEVIE